MFIQKIVYLQESNGIYLSMKEEGKIYYEAPAITAVEVKIEGVICESNVNSGIVNMEAPEDL